MTNTKLAEKLTAEIERMEHRRRVLLTAATALRTTKTLTAARKALENWNGPAGIKTAALAELENQAP